MKKIILAFLILAIGKDIFAQHQYQYNNWHFGIGTAITFSRGYPGVINGSQIISRSASASISDTLGNLLFYSNGDTIWAKDNSIMPNGIGLSGDRDAQQGVLIVPEPDTSDIFYVFTIGNATNGNAKVLRYSVVDMNLNGSLGDVSTKNVTLDSNVTEKLTATKNFNGIDFWVVTRNLGSGLFKSYPVTKNGLGTEPVVSKAGAAIENNDYSGAIKISYNGCWVISTTRGIFGDAALVEVLRFDNNSGILSGGHSTTAIKHPYGLEFSPDSKKFYIGEDDLAPVYQFNLNFNNEADILPSQIAVSDYYPSTYAFQLAPDGKIYFVTQDTASLGRIERPNNFSLYCNVDTAVVTGLNFSTFSLPNNFNLTYTGELSCNEATQGCVVPLDLYMPNAFTPNGDGLNDCYGISRKIKDSLPFIDFAIFDRWGNKVFYTSVESDCWDGTYKNHPADLGNYVYYLRERADCGYAIKTGYVVLIR